MVKQWFFNLPMLRDHKQDLKGISDSHIHVYPEISLRMPNAADDHEWLSEAVTSGMRAVCLKSHYWPTVDKAYTLGRLFPEIGVYGGIVLNGTVGGLNSLAVRVAIENGGKIVWFPTWSAKNDRERGGYSSRVASIYGKLPPPHITVLDNRDRLLPEVEEILSIVAQNDIAVATGHLSVRESKILIREAREKGIGKIVFTHALTNVVQASIEEQREIAAMGAIIEHCFIATLPMHQRLAPEKIVESIKAVGAGNCLISSDAVFVWNPTPPQMMRMFVATLIEHGIGREEIETMAIENPAYILGIGKRK
jgi:hypothetical protein